MPPRPILTGIGSLPAPAEPVDDALRAAAELQRAHGFGVLTDGEPRGDMLSLYTAFPGIEMRAGTPRVVGRIRPLDDPASFPKVRDLDVLRSAYPDAAFKVTLTAPTTFLLACAASGAGPAYRGAMDPVLHDDLAEALRPVARAIGLRGARLQLDDPFLSQGMRDYGPGLRRLDALASEVPRDRVDLHVCGGLAKSKALDALVRLRNVSTLNLAFAGRAERENLALLDPHLLEDHDLRIGAGSIDVQVASAAEVMPPEAVAQLLREITDRAGADRVRFVHPDCGLRGTPRDAVPMLLEHLAKGFSLAFPDGA